MRDLQRVLSLSALALVTAATLAAPPAHATPAHATPTHATPTHAAPAHAASAAGHAGCPSPDGTDVKRSTAGQTDRPPRDGDAALKGVRVDHLPNGFSYGHVTVDAHDGVSEYSYRWSDNRDDVDRKHRSLWVRVVCWPDAHRLTHLRKAPLVEGAFSGDERTVKIGGRQVLARTGDGALGHGRYLGWVERKGTVITVMASQPLVPELDKIIKGIRLPRS